MFTFKPTYRSRYGLVRVVSNPDATYTLTFNSGSAEVSTHRVDRYTLNNLIESGDLK